jgi:N-acetyl-gamma-glutamyl-phosphate reductase
LEHGEQTIRVAVAGATGYTGAELIRYLSRHPKAQIVAASSESMAGQELEQVFPGRGEKLRGLRLVSLEELLCVAADAVFLCLPHGQSAEVGARLAGEGKKVIDLSADFRLPDPALYRQWYGIDHPCPEWLGAACYGLSEFYRDQIRRAQIVANPGCYPTAALLALVPLVRARLIEANTVVIDAKSGLSGAGKTPKPHLHFAEANENVAPYSPGRMHRHVPEIDWYLTLAAGRKVQVIFVPHLIPMDRGILETIYVHLTSGTKPEDVLHCWRAAYAQEPFVRVLEHGLPATKRVAWTNVCELGLAWSEGGVAVLVSAIDNLGKGASGQAVQNLNILFGLEEGLGLV